MCSEQEISRGTEAADKVSSNGVAIGVWNLSKCYQIYGKPQDRLKQGLWRGRKQFYREFWALRDMSFEVKQGETVGIIGRNGSGKSTLLQMICGTLSPTAGTITVNGRVAALLELGAGFNPEFTGRENVYLNGAIFGISREEMDAKFDDIAAFADIAEFIEQPVKTYSSGMYVRLAFAVVAHVNADILVIDEALAVGDAFFTQKCMRFLRRFKESGTLLLVSHDSAAIVNLCNRALWLDKGALRLVGNAKEVCEAYLEALVEAQQGESSAGRNEPVATDTVLDKALLKDQRLDFINKSPHRNDIELFAFNPDAQSFGIGGAKIVDVRLSDKNGEQLAWVVGGEVVVVAVVAKAEQPLPRPIVGFYIKDRLGQTLLGDNTYLSTSKQPVNVDAGQEIEARFEFTMPRFPVGDYSICAAIAEGTQEDHVQHHWVHDALIFRSHTSSVLQGLVSIPMHDIAVSIKGQ